MKKIEYMNNYIKMKSNTGYAIYIGFRLKKYLVVNTFFNPFIFPDFHADIVKLYGVLRVCKICTYDDGSGYIIFAVDVRFTQNIIIDSLEKIFCKHFFNEYIYE